MLTVGVIVALAGWLVDQSREDSRGGAGFGRMHLPVVGGAAVAGALLAASGACAAFSATLTHGVEVPVTAALAGAAAGLAVGGFLCRTAPMYLPYLTAGVAAAATIAALASLATDLPAAIYAAAAALIGVLAELLRVRTERPSSRAGSRRRDGGPTVPGVPLRGLARRCAGPAASAPASWRPARCPRRSRSPSSRRRSRPR